MDLSAMVAAGLGSPGVASSVAREQDAEVAVSSHQLGGPLHLLELFGRHRIFPTQQQAFECRDRLHTRQSGILQDIDSAAAGGEGNAEVNVGESPNRTTLRSPLRRRAARRERSVSYDRLGSSPFRKDQQQRRVAVYCIESAAPLVASPPHQDGRRPTQTRFFVVATLDTVETYFATVPPDSQSLYEIIAEGSPCFLYLDVECSPEDVAPPPTGLDGQEVPAAAAAQLDRRVRLERRVCPFDCPVATFDPSRTTELLLQELNRFLSATVHFPPIVGDSASSRSHVVVLESVVHRANTTSKGTTTTTTRGKFSQHYVVRPMVEEDDGDDGDEGSWTFRNNADVGLVVSAFVQHLYGRALDDPNIHRALFYHGLRDDAKDTVPTERSRRSSAELCVSSAAECNVEVPVYPLRCIIDEAVYTRNRMFRCLGSRKLGKSAVLDLAVGWPMATALATPPRAVVERGGRGWLAQSLVSHHGRCCITPPDATQQPPWFISSDVCEAVFHATMVGLGGASGRAAVRAHNGFLRAQAALPSSEGLVVGGWSSSPHKMLTNREGESILAGTDKGASKASPAVLLSAKHLPLLCAFILRLASAHPPSVGSSAAPGLTAPFITRISASSQSMLVAIGGRRYCHHVRRDHRSNGVFFVVRRGSRDVVQRCHDPDCSGRQSLPTSLPPEIWAELSCGVGWAGNGEDGNRIQGQQTTGSSSPTPTRPLSLEAANADARLEHRRRCTRFVPAAELPRGL